MRYILQLTENIYELKVSHRLLTEIETANNLIINMDIPLYQLPRTFPQLSFYKHDYDCLRLPIHNHKRDMEVEVGV